MSDLAQRYPNVLPRLMTPHTMTKEGKAISCFGKKHPGTEWGDLIEICTIDGNNVNELHFIRIAHLSQELQDLIK